MSGQEQPWKAVSWQRQIDDFHWRKEPITAPHNQPRGLPDSKVAKRRQPNFTAANMINEEARH